MKSNVWAPLQACIDPSMNTNSPVRALPKPICFSSLSSSPNYFSRKSGHKQKFTMKLSFFLFVALPFSMFLQGTLGEIICETLPTNLCSFAIASSGKRCALESYSDDKGKLENTCKTSEVVVERIAGYIESDQCVNACGVDRSVAGIFSDAFLVQQFTARLCSPACYQNCPNIVDLYFNLAAGEGINLPALCENQKAHHHHHHHHRGTTPGTPGMIADAPSPSYFKFFANTSAPALLRLHLSN